MRCELDTVTVVGTGKQRFEEKSYEAILNANYMNHEGNKYSKAHEYSKRRDYFKV
jgi:hypothetical protein